MKNYPWHCRAAFILALLMPFYFGVAALGTKFGLWSWQIGLGSLVIGAGPMLLGIAALVALISLIVVVSKPPRAGWHLGLIALLIPLGIFGVLGSISTKASDNPIHDVATDTANPPQFSEAVVSEREQADANPLNDYGAPVGEMEMGQGLADEAKAQSLGTFITTTYPELEPIELGNANRDKAITAVEDAMKEMGFTSVTSIAAVGIVQGVDTSFWFGFQDDVVARIGDERIDFRSVSRVGQSDLGANAERVAELRAKVAGKLAE